MLLYNHSTCYELGIAKKMQKLMK